MCRHRYVVLSVWSAWGRAGLISSALNFPIDSSSFFVWNGSKPIFFSVVVAVLLAWCKYDGMLTTS